MRHFADDGVAGILAFGEGGEDEAGGEIGRHILGGMDGEINGSGEEGFFDFLGEEAFGADFAEGDVSDFVAGGLDDFDAGGVACGLELGGDVVGLPEGEFRTAGADD